MAFVPVVAAAAPTPLFCGGQFDEPPIVRTFQYQTIASCPFVEALPPEVITADKWAQPLSIPGPRKRTLNGFFQNTAVAVERVWIDAVLGTQPDRIPPKPRLPEYGFTNNPLQPIQPVAPSVATWAQPLPERLNSKVRLSDYGFTVTSALPPSAGETITVDKWYQPLALPGRPLRKTGSLEVIVPIFTQALPASGWEQPLSIPVRRSRLVQDGNGSFVVVVVASQIPQPLTQVPESFSRTRRVLAEFTEWFVVRVVPVNAQPAVWQNLASVTLNAADLASVTFMLENTGTGDVMYEDTETIALVTEDTDTAAIIYEDTDTTAIKYEDTDTV